ncbi:MAG TPA: alpha/beta hydrolase [Pirellulales bacterium]|nr:alpha/beta hydrolase [Pirellulales bacterium]
MMHLIVRHRRLLAGAMTLTALSLAMPNILLPADPVTNEKPKDRPAQTPVSAENTVRRLDIAYGEDEKQRLDVYSPKGAKRAPVIIFVHGGEWTRGDKTAVSYKPKFLNENGVVFVSVNYRLTPPAKHPAHVQDVASAVRWVYDHASEIGGDPRKIILMGHSAGCHLVTLAALDPRYLSAVRLKPADLAGVVAWSGGAYDLVAKVEAGGSYAEYIKKSFGDSEAAWHDASPVKHAKNAAAGPAFMFISVERGNASHQAAENLAQLIQKTGGKAETHLLEGRDHFNANHLLGAPNDTTGAILCNFVRKVVR